MHRAGVRVAVVKSAEQITVNKARRALDSQALHTAWWHCDLPSRPLLKACPNAQGKNTATHEAVSHYRHMDTDPFKPALSPPTKGVLIPV